jgi:hypothetical protein
MRKDTDGFCSCRGTPDWSLYDRAQNWLYLCVKKLWLLRMAQNRACSIVLNRGFMGRIDTRPLERYQPQPLTERMDECDL